MNEKDYANKSWPGKLPKDWESQITVEFQRTYRPEEQPTSSNINGNISRSILLPTVPGGEGNPDNELYEAWASVEVGGDIELLTRDAERKSLDGQVSVKWTIPFKLKSTATQRASFTLIFKVHLRNKKTGVWAITPYHLGQEAIVVDWIPGTRGNAYLLFGLLFPTFSLGAIGFSRQPLSFARMSNFLLKAQNNQPLPPQAGVDTPLDKAGTPEGRHVNAWLVNGQLPLIVDRKYQVGVNIGSLRQNTIGGGAFTEPNWRAKTELELLIALNSLDAEVTPEWTTAILPRYGDMKTVFFDVVPKQHENIKLSLSIYLKRDSSLLEKFHLRLPTIRAAAARR